MTKARNISDLLDANGDVKSGALDNVPPSNDASALTTGTIDNARISLDANEIPNLDANKITSGSLGADRIPNLDTAKITTGTLADARLPSTALNSNVDLTNLSASNMTSGTLPDARFPATLPAVSGANLTNLPAGGKIGQVVSTNKTDTFSETVSSGSFSSLVTGLTVSITPSATSSKILVFVNMNVGADGEHGLAFQLFRDTTQIDLADASSSRARFSKGRVFNYAGNGANTNLSTNFLDSPSSTSALTYGVKIAHTSGNSRPIYINRTHDDSNSAQAGRGASTITVMEILA
jgi:hypothetical protein